MLSSVSFFDIFLMREKEGGGRRRKDSPLVI
jgi:hypothetical protein